MKIARRGAKRIGFRIQGKRRREGASVKVIEGLEAKASPVKKSKETIKAGFFLKKRRKTLDCSKSIPLAVFPR